MLITALFQQYNNNWFSQTNFQHQACPEINCTQAWTDVSHVPAGGFIKSIVQQGAVKHQFYYGRIVHLTLLCVTMTTTDAVAVCIVILKTCELN